VPPDPGAAVPESWAVPVPAVNVTPVGKVPLSDRVGVGTPLAEIVNVPAVPVTKLVLDAEVTTGATGFTTLTVKFCVVVASSFAALMTIGYVPPEPETGVPEIVAEPDPPVNVTPEGRAPVTVIDGVGIPDAATGKVALLAA